MSSDLSIIDSSFQQDTNSKPFLEKQVLWVADSNNGAYNGSIFFDSLSLSNNGLYGDYKNAELQIPLVVSLKSDQDITTPAHAYMCGVKSGFHQIIDSVRVDFGNQNVVQISRNTNHFISYKIMSEWSENELRKYGDVCMVSPDDGASYTRSAGASAGGNGSLNNSPYAIAEKSFASTAPIKSANDGFAHRLELTAKPAGGAGGVPTMTTAAQHSQNGMSYFSADTGSGAARIYSWYMIATIRLKDMCDFFHKLPLIKGAQIRIQLYYNAVRTVTTGVAVGPTQVVTSTTVLSGNSTQWAMLPTSIASGAGNVLVTGGGVITLEANVRATSSPAATNPMLTSARLYVPFYYLSPEVEQQYLASNKVKTIMYEDVFSYEVGDITAGSSFNQLLSNSIVNPQKVIVLPYISGTAGQNATNALDPWSSPFDSCPATTSPYCSLTSFNVQVSGKNIWQENFSYDFQNFLEESSKSGVDGGDRTICSGLVSYSDFESAYRYYVADVSRRAESQDLVGKSIAILGVNNSSTSIVLRAFVTYLRSISIDTQTGAVIV